MEKNKIKELLFQSKEIKDFCIKNNFNDNDIIRNLAALSLYGESKKVCDSCDKLNCLNNVKDMIPTLVIEVNKKAKIIYEDCPYIVENNPGNLELISYTDTNLDDIEITETRLNLFKRFEKFTNDYFSNKNDTICKGLFLYGKCGVGKSLLIYRFAKNLAGRGAKVLFAYYPDLVRELQNSIGTPKLEALVVKLKTADIVILDDIAREANTAYIRDEIFGPILQYRCDNNLPMFMTSNRDFRLLEKHLSETNNIIDTVKAKAIIERIKYLTKEYELIDRDYRNNDK